MKVNYEEKQFEAFFYLALYSAEAGVDLAPVGQVLEARLGYDLGLNAPLWHPIWQHLASPYLRGGSVHLWNTTIRPSDAVSRRLVNIFFQFKRPEYLTGRNAAHYHVFNSAYFRFKVDRSLNGPYASQHDLLEQLATSSAGKAIVRYAAPTCIDYRDLQGAADSGSLLARTVFVEPMDFQPDHERCSFTGPHDALMNPEPERTSIENWEGLVPKIQGIVGDVVEGSDAIDDAYRWALELREGERAERPPLSDDQDILSDESLELLRRASIAADEFGRLGLMWLFALEAPPR